MAPRKPAPKAAKPTAKPKAKMTVWPAEPAAHAHVHDHHHHHDHPHGESCGCHHGAPKGICGLFNCLCSCCPIAAIVFTRAFWAASVVAFIVIFATDWLLHTRFLMSDYAATTAFWRVDGEIRHGLIFISQALTAMVYATIIIGMGHATRWWGSATSGILAAAPVALCAFTSYIMLPFATPYIPTVWAVASLLQGALVGLAICAALRASRTPQAACCSPTIH